eukprot:jgi/Bigna1/130418/aug1.11_g5126
MDESKVAFGNINAAGGQRVSSFENDIDIPPPPPRNDRISVTRISGAAALRASLESGMQPGEMEEKDDTYNVCGFEVSQTALLISLSVVGIVFGIILNSAEASESVVDWVSLPGSLFLRMLKCLVIPMIFCNMVMGVADLSELGQQGVIGTRTFALYSVTTVLACVEGLVCILIFRGLFKPIKLDDEEGTKLSFKCSDGDYIAEGANGTLTCGGLGNRDFETSIASGKLFLTSELPKRTISQTIIGIFESICTDNIFQALTTPDVLSVIVFAVFFGFFASTLKVGKGRENKVLSLFDQLNEILQSMVKIIIRLAPYAVFFMIAGALSAASNLVDLLQNVGVLVVAVLVGHAFHALVMLPALYFFFVRENPYTYMAKCLPAYTFAFGCASSGATLPVTTQCVEATGEVPSSVAKFVLSLGATINMDGSAIYFPACMVFLADTSGMADEVTSGTLLTILLVSTVGAVGASPIPNAGLVMIVTIWEAVFSGIKIPNQVAYLQAIDWLLDRSVTVVNVCGDSLVTRMIAAIVADMPQGKASLLDNDSLSDG